MSITTDPQTDVDARNRESFAMRHRGKRAALLAGVLREQWAVKVERARWDDHDPDPDPMELARIASDMTEQAWAGAAELAGITVPSETTRAICIGLLLAPERATAGLKGLR